MARAACTPPPVADAAPGRPSAREDRRSPVGVALAGGWDKLLAVNRDIVSLCSVQLFQWAARPAEVIMFLWGIVILLAGIATLFLPMFGVPLRFMAIFGANAQYAGIAIAVIGGVMAYLGMRHDD
jgi:hypothetical protein